MTKRTPPYSPEVRARAVRMVLDHQGEHASQRAAIASIAAKIGCNGETLRNWVRQVERDQGRRSLTPSVGMVNEPAANRPPLVQRLLQPIQHEAGVPSGSPASRGRSQPLRHAGRHARSRVALKPTRLRQTRRGSLARFRAKTPRVAARS
jgi:transposase-like protein